MVDAKELFVGRKYPGWIKDHDIFKSNKKVSKVFPEIGLPNTEKEVQIDNTHEARQAAQNLLHQLYEQLEHRFSSLGKFKQKKSEIFTEKRTKKLENCRLLVQSIKNKIHKSPNKFIVVNNGRITLNLPEDIIDVEEKVAFKAGEGLIRVYNKLNETLRAGHFLAMEKVDNLPRFKEFSTKNVPVLKYTLKFSSDGADGVWDIATMSMRGISSCQTWAGGATNSAHLIGSMIDPFTGIIYLTSGGKFNEYGSKMIRRCVARFVVNEKTKKPCIMLERMYPALENGTLKMFKDFIAEKTDKKFDILYAPETSYANTGYYVPMARSIKQLDPINQPYRDSGIAYKSDANDKFAFLKDQADGILEKLYLNIATKVITTAKQIKIGSVPEASKEAFRAMRGSSYYYDYSNYVHRDIILKMRSFFQKYDITKFEDLPSFLDESLNDLLEKGIEKLLYSSIKKTCNKYVPKSLGKVGDDTLKFVSATAATKVVEVIKEELSKVIKTTSKKNKKTDTGDVPVYVKLLN